MRKTHTLIKCIECEHAALMQRDRNPIIAACGIRGGVRYVAEFRRVCADFKQREKAADITPI